MLEEGLYVKLKEHRMHVSLICRFVLHKAVEFVEQPRKSSDHLSSLDKEILKMLGMPLNIQK